MWSDGNADAERTITVTEDITLTAEFVHDTATELDNVQNGNATVQKVYQDGTLFIIREGKKYNANGQLVK
jgi:hypothetical protein